MPDNSVMSSNVASIGRRLTNNEQEWIWKAAVVPHFQVLYRKKYSRVFKPCIVIYRCPTGYGTRHFFNNFTTNDDIATKFEANLPYCVRNVKEKNVLLFKYSYNIFIGVRIIKEMPGLVANGTPCTYVIRTNKTYILYISVLINYSVFDQTAFMDA
jgi:hypothetical protein